MNKYNKLNRRINLVFIIAFAIVILLNYWSVYEKNKLNQRYEQSIEQFEIIVQDYQDLEHLLRSYVQKLEVE
ncbi:hypothetical protein GCM10008933_11990 [Paenibacillus motobuensis]|uniref:Uncharacterized protein n=1 Tax=Paenibacillus motobuensis TaxID=295324 RepID=A0ABP3HX02_9BACL